MRFQCLHIVVMEPFGRVGLDLFVHCLDHAIRPRMLDQRGAVLNAFCLTQRDERVLLALGLLLSDQRVIAELDAVVGEDFLDFERVLRHGVFKEAGGGFHAFVVMQLQIDISGRPVDGDKQVELVLAEVDLGGVDMQETWFIRFESLGGGFFFLRQQVGKAADAVALQATVQVGAGQRRYLRQQQVVQIIQRQQGLAPGLNDDRLVNCGQHAALARTSPALEVFYRFPVLPLMDGLRVDIVT